MKALIGIILACFLFGLYCFVRIMKGIAKLKEQNDRIYEDKLKCQKTIGSTYSSGYNKVPYDFDSTLIDIKDLSMSARLFRCLNAAEIKWLEQVTVRTKKEISRYRHLGKKSLIELETLMNEHNLKFKAECFEKRYPIEFDDY